jgi:hypothetical protein
VLREAVAFSNSRSKKKLQKAAYFHPTRLHYAYNKKRKNERKKELYLEAGGLAQEGFSAT